MAVIAPFPISAYFDVSDMTKAQLPVSGRMKYAYEHENNEILEASKRHGQFIPFLGIAAGKHSNHEDIERILEANPEVRGFKMHSIGSRSRIVDLVGSPLMRLAEERKLSILAHTSAVAANKTSASINQMYLADPMQLLNWQMHILM